MARRACLAIGVSTVTPPKDEALVFPFLDGAYMAARALGAWALSSSFGPGNVRVVDDGPAEDGTSRPVTQARVATAVSELFPDGADPVDQLILMFSGHGLTDSNFTSISWLFSDSLEEKYRVVADRFYSELQLFGIGRITLISDACREFPKSLDLQRLDAVRGFTAKTKSKPLRLKLDRFAACQDGQQGFMVSDEGSAAPGKCIFSGVIVDALWGLEASAIAQGLVTTSSLGACLLTRPTERAQDYMLTMEPDCTVYAQPATVIDMTQPPAGPPNLQPWPAATRKPAPPHVMELESALLNLSTDTTVNKTGILDLVRKSARGRLRRPRSDELHLDDADAIVLSRSLRQIEAIRHAMTRGELPAEFHVQLKNAKASRTASDLSSRMRLVPSRETVNLLVAAPDVYVWSLTSMYRAGTEQGVTSFVVSPPQSGIPVMVGMGNEIFTPVVLYPSVFTTIALSDKNEVFQAFGSRYMPHVFKQTVRIIQQFAAGRITRTGVDEITAVMRESKHEDPMLGVLCAHLYRATGDIDSIRRMAFFYVQHHQPVPFDIALLGELHVERSADGILGVNIPRVEARDDQESKRLPSFVTRATPEAIGVVGGRCPWIGLGWDYVVDPRPESAALVEGLAEFAPKVRRSGCTEFDKPTAQALAQRWGIPTERP